MKKTRNKKSVIPDENIMRHIPKGTPMAMSELIKYMVRIGVARSESTIRNRILKFIAEERINSLFKY